MRTSKCGDRVLTWRRFRAVSRPNDVIPERFPRQISLVPGEFHPQNPIGVQFCAGELRTHGPVETVDDPHAGRRKLCDLRDMRTS